MFIGAVAGAGAIVFAACNQPFVAVWMHGEISWPTRNDVLLAAWIVVNTVAHAHCAFVGATGKIGTMRYVYFVEGALFILLASLGSQVAGMTAIIAASVLCTTFVSGLYGIFHTARYCKFPLLEVAFGWQRPMAKLVLFLAPVAGAVWWTSRGWSPILRLPVNAALVGGPAPPYYYATAFP